LRVVPVIDLKEGTAVHTVRGERQRYRPVRSVLAGDDGDPHALGRAFRFELGLDELYVADLDAIGGTGDNSATIGVLSRDARVMVDAGVTEPVRAHALLDLGAHRVIVGTETLRGPDALARLLGELPDGAVILSVGLRDGRLLSADDEVAGLPALDAVARLHRAGLRELIVLDLARGQRRRARPRPRRRRPRRLSRPRAACGRRRAQRRGPPSASARRRGGRARRDGAAYRRYRAARAGRASYTTASTCATSAAATSAPVAFWSPCQPGIPLSSST
jgi:phosphoribosylformimino-5-aminoimidazole carboxamide ribotide isomerase